MTTLNMVPEFTPEEPMVQEKVQPLESPSPETEEKETPSEPPAEEKPVLEGEPSQNVETGELEKQVQGLQTEREKLLGEIRDLRGQRREIKQQELQRVDPKGNWNWEEVKTNPAANIRASAAYYGYLTKLFNGNEEQAIVAYKIGPTAARRIFDAKGASSISEKSQIHLARTLIAKNKFKKR